MDNEVCSLIVLFLSLPPLHIQVAKLARDLATGNKGPSIPPPKATAATSKPAGAQASVRASAPQLPLKMTTKEVAGMRAELFGDSTSKKEKPVASKPQDVARPPPAREPLVQPPQSHVPEDEVVKSKPAAGDSSTSQMEEPKEGGGGEEDAENEFGGMLT